MRFGRPAAMLLFVLSLVSPLVPTAAAPGRQGRCRASDPVSRYGGGDRPESVLIADVNDDGLNDFLQANSAGSGGPFANTVLVYEQHRFGHFDVPRRLRTDEAVRSFGARMGLASGDFDGDSTRDVAVATDAGINVFYGSDDLAERHLIEMPAANVLAARDFDGDGRPEIVAGTAEGIRLTRVVGQDAYEVTEISSDLAYDMEGGDVTADGRPDLALAVEQGLVVLARQEDGSFARDLYEIESGFSPSGSVAIGDVTGDSRADVAYVADEYVVFEQTPAGLEGHVRDSSTTTGPRAIVDWDGDGRQDVISVSAESGVLAVSFGGSRDTCGYGLPAPNTSQRTLAVGDLNGDKAPDAVVAGANVLMQRTTPLLVPQVATLRVLAKGKRADARAFSLNLTGQFYERGCETVGIVQRFVKGKWKRVAGPLELDPGGDQVRLPNKQGAYRAVVPRSGERRLVSVDCHRTISPYVGNASELRRAGCVSLTSTSAVRLPWLGNDIAIGDFNDDGLSDVAVAALHEQNQAEVVVYFGGQNGRFGSPVEFAAGEAGRNEPQVAAGDFNGDDNDDLAIASSRDVRVYLQANGQLVDRATLTEEPGQFLKTGDLDADGFDDVMSSVGTGSRAWYGPDFSRSSEFPAFDDIMGDLNGDGRPDISRGTGVAYQLEDGAFVGTDASWVQFFPDASAVGDVNGDGRLDRVVMWRGFLDGTIGRDPGGIGTLVQRENGSFAPPRAQGLLAPHAVGIGDVTRDGRADLLVGHYYGDVTIMRGGRNGLGPACPVAGRSREGYVWAVAVASQTAGRGPVIVATRGDDLLVLDPR